MQRRPVENPRRGLLRAAGVVVGLLVLLIIAVLIASAFTAPPANAPTVPPTPGRQISPLPLTTRTSRTPVVHSTASPSRTGTKTHSMRLPAPLPQRTMEADRSAGSLLWRVLDRNRTSSDIPVARSPNGHAVALWRRVGDVYAQNLLFVRTGVTERRVGVGDYLVRPTWSLDGNFLAYVRVQQTSRFPGAAWTLFVTDVRTGKEREIAKTYSMALCPLGWSQGHLLYAVTNSTDTSVYSAGGKRHVDLGILMPQALITMFLSPNGRYVAFAAPTNCFVCTLDVYDLETGRTSVGPTGLPNEFDVAWTADSDTLITILHGRLAVVDPASLASTSFTLPKRLPVLWKHIMVAAASDSWIRLIDTVSGKSYSQRR